MINISKNKCVGCKICKSTCPEGIEILNGRARVKDQNADCLKKAIIACPQGAIREIKQNLLFAIGTDDNKTIKSDDDVGMSKYFQVWEYSDGNLIFRDRRENVKYKEDETIIHGDPGKAKATASVLTDIDVIIGRIYGPNIIRMRNKFVCVVIREPEIRKAIEIIKENINEIMEEKDKKEKTGIVLK